jgi:RimJ/RimL family protein N-acetyltransferase
VISLIRVENTASENVARKIGMVYEREITFAGFATNVWASDSAKRNAGRIYAATRS